MMNLYRTLALVALCLPSVGCVSYSGVATAGNQILISGGTSYFVYTQPWVRRCDVDGNQLRCEELSEAPSAPRAPKGEPAKGAPAK